jgi:DNA-binding IclR family transcriptional regulator
MKSTRARLVRTRGSSTLNRSLERGIEILRAFRPGCEELGNGELVERTGLPPATVSRLTRTLVGTGFLQHDSARRTYRLGAPVLSLAHAMRSGSPVLRVAAPLMRPLAEKLRINVGLAIPDRDEMVYLESVRYNRKVSLRNVVAGLRVPMELTSLGCAYLAVAETEQRALLFAHFKARRQTDWPRIERQIADAIESVKNRGFCTASWQAEVVALATPLVVEGHPVHVLNVSVVTQLSTTSVVRELKTPLLTLAREIQQSLGTAQAQSFEIPSSGMRPLPL